MSALSGRSRQMEKFRKHPIRDGHDHEGDGMCQLILLHAVFLPPSPASAALIAIVRPRGSTSPATRPRGQRRPPPWASLPASPVLGLPLILSMSRSDALPPGEWPRTKYGGWNWQKNTGPWLETARLLCALLGPRHKALVCSAGPFIAMNDVSQRGPGRLTTGDVREPTCSVLLTSWVLSLSFFFFGKISVTCLKAAAAPARTNSKWFPHEHSETRRNCHTVLFFFSYRISKSWFF